MTVEIFPLHAVPGEAVDTLLDAAFGSDCHGRTAYRVRAGATPVDALSLAAADDDGRLIGVIQCWPVGLFDASGGLLLPLIMVGPVAVAPDAQGRGIGTALMRAMLAADEVEPGVPRMMIGDPEYYARFAFSADHTAGWRLPGPFEPRRLLARGSLPLLAGMLGPRR